MNFVLPPGTPQDSQGEDKRKIPLCFFTKTQKGTTIKEQINKLDFITINISCLQ